MSMYGWSSDPETDRQLQSKYGDAFRLGRAPLKIDPTKSFATTLDATDEILRTFRRNAHPECPQCKGEGIYPWGTAERKVCRCTGMLR